MEISKLVEANEVLVLISFVGSTPYVILYENKALDLEALKDILAQFKATAQLSRRT